MDPEHGKQAVLQELPAGEIFSSLALSVVEMNCAYTAERSCKPPVFFFYGMDEPAQERDDVDRFLVRPPEKIILCFSECGREVYAVFLMVDGYKGYNRLKNAKRCCCFAHIRRYLIQAIPKGHERDYTEPAVQGVMYCNKLFAVA